jgi:hypothetical protein
MKYNWIGGKAMRLSIVLCGALIVSVFHEPVYAYIGPGLGAGTIGAVLGLIASVLLAIVAVVWYPFKRFLKMIQRKKHHRGDTP